jgi:hypothetical protein
VAFSPDPKAMREIEMVKQNLSKLGTRIRQVWVDFRLSFIHLTLPFVPSWLSSLFSTIGFASLVLGVAHHEIILDLQLKNIQDMRDIRSSVLTSFCQENTTSQLLIGHSLEESLRSFMRRVSRGSKMEGLVGLSQRAAVSLNSVEASSVVQIRPLLPIPIVSILGFESRTIRLRMSCRPHDFFFFFEHSPNRIGSRIRAKSLKSTTALLLRWSCRQKQRLWRFLAKSCLSRAPVVPLYPALRPHRLEAPELLGNHRHRSLQKCCTSFSAHEEWSID